MKREEALKTAKPILFNTEMVRAILDGSKTVTRRLVKEDTVFPLACRAVDDPVGLMTASGLMRPKYKAGDILYGRETWGNYNEEYEHHSLQCGYMYKSDYPNGANTCVFTEGDTDFECELPKWHPSIHMPKEAARIFLRVTDVRAERLQDIITGDYKTPININHEGLISPCSRCTHCGRGECKDYIAQNSCVLVDAFVKLWNSTIKKSDLDKYGWAANPWVWVIEFEMLEVTND